MPLGKGYVAKAGIAKETVYGTVVAPAEQIPLLPGESVNEIIEFTEQEVLMGYRGREVPDITAIVINGDFVAEGNYQALDILWAQIFGGTTGISGSGPYVHTIDLGEDISRSISLHIEKDVSVWSFGGLSVNTATFTSAPGTNPAQLSCSIIGKNLDRSTTHRAALDALSASGIPRMLFHQCVLRIADCADALQASDEVGHSNLELVINNNLITDQRDTESGLYILQPFANDRREITLNITIPRYMGDEFLDYYTNATNLQADIVFTSGAYIWKLELPTLRVKACDAMIDSAGIVPVNVSMQAYRNDGNTNMSGITEECELTITNDRAVAIWT